MLIRKTGPVLCRSCHRLWQAVRLCSAEPRVKDAPRSTRLVKIKAASRVWSKVPFRIHIVGDDAIELVLKSVSDDLGQDSAVFLEGSPGPGFLTRALLENGCRQLHLFEFPKSDFFHGLKVLQEEHGDRIKLNASELQPSQDNFGNVFDITESNQSADFLTQLRQKQISWHEESVCKVILPLSPDSEKAFLAELLRQYVYQSNLFTLGRPEFYLFLSCAQVWYLTAAHDDEDFLRYRSRTVMFNTLFDIDYLGKVPWKSFVPMFKKRRVRLDQDYFYDIDNAYFVKMTPRRDFASRITPECWCDYAFFVGQTMVKRKNYVIPFLEKWFPNCGPRLIKHGVPLYSRFGDLSPEDFVKLYCEISSWPEYEESTFKVACSNVSVSEVFGSLQD
ncbi:Dimethyladenosine transferase 2, mitochondrial [Halotydeus destructor]|nr:Dimethyladenosine transferase 2, mitochondrial [Halotydeus destructor]